MLLRSSSTPILNSWTSKDMLPESDPCFPQHSKTRSISYTWSFEDLSPKKEPISLSITDSEPQIHKKRQPTKFPVVPKPVPVKDKSQEEAGTASSRSLHRLLSNSGLGDGVTSMEGKSGRALQTVVNGGSGGGRGKRSDVGDSNQHGEDCTDAYYQQIIKANPANALLLSNYAKFLKEVKGDYEKAEEYCARAILTNPDDGGVLSLYADLIWQTQKDAQRAEAYYNQAVKTNPNDCYVQASYARFLWDAEDEDDEKDQVTKSDEYGFERNTAMYVF